MTTAPSAHNASASAEKRPLIDIPTLIAISMTAWALANVFHEVVGHAGSALALGIAVEAVSTTTVFFEPTQNVSLADYRILHAAATVVNVLTGALALAALHFRMTKSKSIRCFLWLFATMSLIIAAMNLVTAPLLGGGDWTEVTTGLEPRALYVAAIVCVGVVLTVVAYVISLRAWMPEVEDRTLRLKITLIPIATLAIFQSLSLVGSPFATAPVEDNHLIASVFAYVHFGIWAIVVNRLRRPRSSEPLESIRLERSTAWLMTGAVVFLLFVLVLGPGLGPLGDDPRLR